MERGIVVLTSLAIAFALILLIICVGLFISRYQRLREGYIPMRDLIESQPLDPPEFLVGGLENIRIANQPSLHWASTVSQIREWLNGYSSTSKLSNRIPSNYVTPLWIACKNGHTGIARILLEKGASTETMDKSGRTPMFVAAEEGRETVVRLLLEWGAKCNTKDTFGRTPQSVALEKGHNGIVMLLHDEVAASTKFLSDSLVQRGRVVNQGQRRV